MSTYGKPFLTYDEQVELLRSRGMVIDDIEWAKEHLRRVGYYRFSAYTYPFRKFSTLDPSTPYRSDHFTPGTRFEQVIDLYVLDKNLRMLALDAIERIEVAVRADIAYLLGPIDRFAQHNPQLLDQKFVRSRYSMWLQKHNERVDRSAETFVNHFKQRYGLPLPIWVSIEVWDFGMLSHFYSGLKGRHRDVLAQRYMIPDGRYMTSWLRSLNFVRNVAAHHSRLWNKNIIDQPRIPSPAELPRFVSLHANTVAIARPYAMFCIMKHFLDQISPTTSWPSRLATVVSEFDQIPGVSIADLGFPPDWITSPIWVPDR